MSRRSTLSLLALAGFACLLAPAPAAAAPRAEVGHVVAVDGLATASTPGQPSRPLACGDPIHADERLETAPGARLVVARQGRHVHLGPDSQLFLREVSDGASLTVLARGHARVIDGRELPVSRIATAAGPLRAEASDFELRRLAGGVLQVCDWSNGIHAVCRRIDGDGLIWQSVEEGPRIDLGIGDLCPWQGREGFEVADFMGTPHVASGLEPLFEPEFDPGDPGCGGDECTTSDPELPPPPIVYTVDAPIIFIP